MTIRHPFRRTPVKKEPDGQTAENTGKGAAGDRKGAVLLILVITAVAAALIWIFLEWSGFWAGGTPALTREKPIFFASRYLEAKYPGKTFIFSAPDGYKVGNGWLFRFADEDAHTAYEGTGQDGKFPYIILVSETAGAGYKAGDDYYITYISDDAESYIRDFLEKEGFACRSVLAESASIGGLDYNSSVSFADFTDGTLDIPLRFTVFVAGTDTAPDGMTAEAAADALRAEGLTGRYCVYVERDGKTTANVNFDI